MSKNFSCALVHTYIQTVQGGLSCLSGANREPDCTSAPSGTATWEEARLGLFRRKIDLTEQDGSIMGEMCPSNSIRGLHRQSIIRSRRPPRQQQSVSE